MNSVPASGLRALAWRILQLVYVAAALLFGSMAVAHAACSTSSPTLDMTGQIAGGAGVTLDESGNCPDVRSGLYQVNGADTYNNFPVSGTVGNNVSGDAGFFTTSKATYKVVIAASDPKTGYYVDIYTVSIVSLVPGESGGTDSFTMFYGPGSDAMVPILHNATASYTVNISNLPASPLSAPTITAAFSPTTIATSSGSTSTLTLTITNPNATQLTGVAVAASPLPAGLNGTSPATTCTSGTATFAGSSLNLSGGVVNASSSCTVTLTVSSSTAGNYSYTTGVVSASGPASVTGTTATTATALTAVGPVVTQAIASTTLTQNQSTTTFTPVTGSGGTPPLTYTISPTLPPGLTISSATGAISGSPAATLAATTFTVTVTDANSATGSKTFSLTVNAAVTATQAVATKTLTQNQAVTPFTPVTGAGGTAPLTYSVTPSLPTGLSFNASTGAITGTPTATSASTTYTVTVTDANLATATNTFSLTINSAVTATQAVASVTLTAGHAATSFTPVTGGGGSAPLSYGVSPGLPAGLSLNTSTGAITGTPASATTSATYTVTVADSNGATATNTFGLTVNGAVTATQAIPSKSLTINNPATSFAPVTGAGGTAPLTYSVSPTLPAGLSLNAATGAVTGLPTATSSATTYTVTVTDANNVTATATFSLAVNSAVTAAQSIASKTLTQNAAAAPFTPVTGSGGTSPLTYTISPALPAGLSLTAASGAISGTPTTALAATTFTVTVTDANGATATNTFGLTISGAVTATQAIPSSTLTANHAATAFTPVTGGGGTAPLAYSVSPTLPAGLGMSTSNGSISGTPTATIGATTFTVTLTDANGATASATFSLTVSGAVIATTAVPSTALPINQAVTPFTPVTGSGGTGALAYAISPSLPAGLAFNAATGAISGTPTAALPNTTFTVTIADTNSATASAAFNLSVGQVATTIALTSSQNPSQFGQPVTFTATVTGAGGTPTGTVTFNDNGSPIGTGTVSAGVASFSTSALAVGNHTVTASYGGSALFAPSTSPALAQSVNVPADSVKLHALQVNVTKTVAQNSGQAITGAIDDAISDGFSDGGAFVTPGNARMRFNFSADPRDEDDAPASRSAAGAGGDAYSAARNGGSDGTGRGGRGRSRVDDAFAAIDQQMPGKAVPKWHQDKQWLLWAEVRGSGIDRWNSSSNFGVGQVTEASLHGQQVNALMGLTYRAAPNLLVGLLGGYENFSYTEDDINGKLRGDGWTVGSYLAWRITPTLRYDVAAAYSGIGYNGTAGTAQGNFNGDRWLVSTGLTGSYKWANFYLEPSAKVYALWERENAYVDSLGAQQSAHNFASGRASAGSRLSYPVPWLDSVLLAPYVGVYADYYFMQDDAAAIVAAGGIPLASTPLLQGWSARVTGGVGGKLTGGAALALGGELGGIGGNTITWTLSGRAHIPFTAQ